MLAIVLPGSEPWWFALPTKDVARFFQWTINKFAYGFLMLYTMDTRFLVPWEHSRLMVMFLHALRSCWGVQVQWFARGVFIRHVKKELPDGRVVENYGMGFNSHLAAHGYTWMSDFIRWDEHNMAFLEAVASKMLFDSNWAQTKYKKRVRQAQHVGNDFQRMGAVEAWMREFAGDATQVAVVQEFVDQLLLSSFRKEVWSALRHDMVKQDVLDLLQGRQTLTYPNIMEHLLPDRHDDFLRNQMGDNPKSFAKLKVRSPEAMAYYLWGWYDGHSRGNWEHKPYRELFRWAVSIIHHYAGINVAQAWARHFLELFYMTNWIVPYPSKQSFFGYRPSARHDSRAPHDRFIFSWWSNYNADLDRFLSEHPTGQKIAENKPIPAAFVHYYPKAGWVGQGILKYPTAPPISLIEQRDSAVYDFIRQIPVNVAEGNIDAIHPFKPVMADQVRFVVPDPQTRVTRARARNYPVGGPVWAATKEVECAEHQFQYTDLKRRINHMEIRHRQIRRSRAVAVQLDSSEEENPVQSRRQRRRARLTHDTNAESGEETTRSDDEPDLYQIDEEETPDWFKKLHIDAHAVMRKRLKKIESKLTQSLIVRNNMRKYVTKYRADPDQAEREFLSKPAVRALSKRHFETAMADEARRFERVAYLHPDELTEWGALDSDTLNTFASEDGSVREIEWIVVDD